MKKLIKLEKETIFLILGILIIGFFIFKDFFLLKNLYIYIDIGSDTYNSYWPYLAYLSEMIYNGNFSFWSFNIGAGTNMFSNNPLLTDPFNIFATIWGERLLVYVLPYIVLLKITVASLGFFSYLKYIGINNYSSLIVSLLYGFNGYIILWGQHYHMGTIVVFVPLVLLGFEKWVREKKSTIYITSLFFVAFSSYYFLFMFVLFFIIYVLVRYFEIYKFELRHFVVFIVKIAMLSILAIGLSSFILLPSVFVALSNARVSGELIGSSIFNFASAIDYLTIILRFFSNDILGTGDQFYGLWNYYEAPILYSGTLSFLLVPLFFIYANKKEKTIYGSVILLLFLFLLFPFFSQLFNAFSANSYRWTFIIVAFISIINAKSLNYITENKLVNLKKANLFLIFFVIVFISVTSLIIGNDLLNWSSFFTHSFKHLFVSLILLSIYFFLIKNINRDIGRKVLVCFICIELAVFSAITVNRVMLSKESMDVRIGYNDFTIEAIHFINEKDKDFYRIDKSYNSVFLADSVIQGYKGVKAYNSLNQNSYVEFLRGMGIPFQIMDHPNYLTGLNANTTLSRLLGVRYLLVNNSAITPNGYQLINEIENIKIYKDKYALPLGYTYDKYITYEDFMKFNAEERANVLLKSFVSMEKVEEELNYKKYYPSEMSNSNHISKVSINENDVELVNIEPISGSLETSFILNALNIDPQIILNLKPIEDERKSIKVSMIINSDINSEGQIFWGREDGFFEENSVKFNYEQGTTYYETTFDYSLINKLRIDVSNVPGQFTISDLKIEIVDNDTLVDIENLKEKSLKILEYSDNHFRGRVTLEKPERLVMSIPFDKGWKAKVNGESTKVLLTNLGFIGIDLPAGNNIIELNFVPPLFITGSIITLVLLLGIITYKISMKIRLKRN